MTPEHRNKIIDQRVLETESRILMLEMDIVGLRLAGDMEMITQTEKVIRILQGSIVEFEQMKVSEDAES